MIRTTPFATEHDQLRESVRRWVEAELVPHVDAWEAGGRFPDTVFRRAGELGLLGLTVPVEDGGQGADAWADVVLLEEVAVASTSVGMALAVQTDVAPLRLHGTDAQRKRWLAPALAGEVVVAVAVTESAGGSDPGAITTTATVDGDGWVLDGAKAYVTNGARADVVLVVAATDDGPSLFLVETDLPGVAVDEVVDTVGMRSSDTAMLSFDGVRLAADALVGPLGGADRVLATERQREALNAAVLAVGAAGAELSRAMAYAREREAFGRPIARFQAVRHRLVDMATAVDTTRQQVYAAVERWTAGERTDTVVELDVAIAKLDAARTAWQVADDGMQVHGGYGYSEEFPVERVWRDVRALRLVAGADEVQRERIADRVVADPSLVVDPPRSLFDGRYERVRADARVYVEAELTPRVAAWEADRDHPRDTFRSVGDAGWFGAKFAPRFGGTGPDLLAEVCWIEELARAGSGGLAADLGAHSQLAALYIARQGTDQQKDRWLVPSITGEAVGALAITEPGAGSDVNGIRTRARRDDGDWVIDGSKVFITNGAWCDHVVVAARTDAGAGHGGMTLFVVDRDTPGFSARRMKMLGWRTSHTGELTFDGVRVPDDNRLGDEGAGFYAIMQNFAWERLMLALGAVVAAEESLAAAIRHATDRVLGGRPLADRQAWRHRFADLATRIAAARALTDHATTLHVVAEGQGSLHDPGSSGAPSAGEVDPGEVLRATAMAKLVTQRLAVDAADELLQVTGAAGYAMDHPAQRWLRDARLGPIGGGTDDIMREIVAGTYGL